MADHPYGAAHREFTGRRLPGLGGIETLPVTLRLPGAEMTLQEPARNSSLEHSRTVVDDFIPNPRGHLELNESVVLDGEMLED